MTPITLLFPPYSGAGFLSRGFIVAIIRARDTGRTWDTAYLRAGIDPMFCSSCGERVGWYDTGHGDEPVGYCDHCAGDLKDEPEDEPSEDE